MEIVGILCAVGALISWGVGDFLIQRTSRRFGIWESLFAIAAFGAIVLLPFAWNDFWEIDRGVIGGGLLLLGALTLAVAALEFRAFVVGKMAVVEPIMSFELPLTVLLGVLLLDEGFSFPGALLVGVIFIGILLLSYRGEIRARHLLEKGAVLAIVATGVMAGVNFFTGLLSIEAGPILTNWFVDVFLALASLGMLAYRREVGTFFKNLRRKPLELGAVAVFDNAAWLFYSFAVLSIPLSLAITISEGYIALAIMLGVWLDKERLRLHQWIGVGVVVAGVITLAAIS